MLDLVSVAGQLRRMRDDLSRLGDDVRARTARAAQAWSEAVSLGPALRDRVAAARTSWLVAEPLEDLRAYPAGRAEAYRVVASDGSQVFPDRHELVHCFVVNVGTADIDYRAGSAALRSEPSVLHLPEDVYPLFGGVRQEADGRVVAARRFAAECRALEFALPDAQVLLMDGTLLLWWLEPDPDRLRALDAADVKRRTLDALERLLAAARHEHAAVAGYLSSPRATDVVSMLKVVLCTETPVDCDRCPYASGAKAWAPSRDHRGPLPPPARPCEEAESVTDAALFERLLSPGERSPRFRSAARVTEAYPCPVDFVYLHTGTEIARLEFPAWTGPATLEALVAAVADQCAKGGGYPVSLAEAHEQAVVRWGDRRTFVDLVRRGDPAAPAVTAKLARKRQGVL